MTRNVVLLAARILLSAIFIMAGLSKFGDGGQTAGMIANAGLPAASLLAILAAVFETVAGLARSMAAPYGQQALAEPLLRELNALGPSDQLVPGQIIKLLR